MRRLLWVPAAFLALFWAWPMVGVLAQAASAEAWAWAIRPYLRDRVQVALAQGFLSVALALAAAALLVWVHRRHVRGVRLLWAVHVAPFVLPVFVVVPGLRAALPLGELPPIAAVAVANAYYNAGLAGMLLHGLLRRRPRRLEEAAQVLGANRRDAFLRVSIPLLSPAAAAIALLVLLFCLQSFGVVLYLGQGEVDTLETLLFSNMSGAFPRHDRAALLALLQVALTATLLVAQARLQKRHGLEEDDVPPPQAGPLRHVVAYALALAWLVPVVAVLASGFRLHGEWTLLPWRTLLDPAAAGHLPGFDLGRALGWSLLYAAVSTAFAIVLCLTLALGARRLRRLHRILESVAALPLGTSSLVIGTALVTTFHAGFGPVARGSPFFVVVAHTLVAFPFASRLVVPALDAVPQRLDQAAHALGAGPWSVAARVHLPLLAAPLGAAAAVAAAMSLGDFGASLLLSPGDRAGLGIWIHRHGPLAFSPLARAQAAALAGLLLVLTLPLAAAAAWRRPQDPLSTVRVRQHQEEEA